jgi:hypothetical protein
MKFDKADIEWQLSKECTATKIRTIATTIHNFHYECIRMFGTHIAASLVNMVEKGIFSTSTMSRVLHDKSSDIFTKLHNERTNYYHTTFHCFDLAKRAHIMSMEQRSIRLSRWQLIVLMMAAFYHDYDHSHGKFKDDTLNVDIAIAKFVKDSEAYKSTFDEIQDIYKELNFKDAVIQIIKYSKYPYEQPPSDMFDLVETFRLLDVFQSLENDVYASQRGLFNEMNLDISFAEFLSKSAEFVKGFDHVGYFNESHKTMKREASTTLLELSKYLGE